MQLFIVKVESLVITNEYVVVKRTLSLAHSARHVLGVFEVRNFCYKFYSEFIDYFSLSYHELF